MRSITLMFLALALTAAPGAFAGGEAEGGAGATRGSYLAGEGIVIPPEEIFVESYIASVDYGYPDPAGDVGVHIYTGNERYSSAGGEGLLHIGIQGGRRNFEDLPPMNLAFVVDRSGSMAEADKLAWVKDAFDVLLDRIRDQDYLSLVTFNDEVDVVFPPTRMSTPAIREEFRRAVRSISAGGGSDLEAGLNAGYEQVLGNYRARYTNRVLFLSDGTEISSRLSAAGAQSGDIRVTLVWDNRNDMDLYVVEPSGETVYYANRRSASGGQLDVDMNVRGETDKPVENIFWPEGDAPAGRYRVLVRNFSYNESNRGPFPFTVEIKNGGEVSTYEGVVQGTGAGSEVVVAEFDYQTGEVSRAGVVEIAEAYRELDVYLSTIGVGVGFDVDLMVNLARAGGGSSRFISDAEEMERIFGSEFDRMAVPAAHNLDMELVFEPDIEVLETWGYNHLIDGNRVRYRLGTLHNRDYETILVRYRLPPQERTGIRNLARFSVDYDRVASGGSGDSITREATIEIIEGGDSVVGFSNSMVLRSGTVLHFTKGIARIGEIFYSARESGSAERLRAALNEVMELTVELRRELSNAALRLEEEDFADELEILSSYVDIFAGELDLSEEEIAGLKGDVEIAPPTPERPITDQFANLFDEMLSGLSTRTAAADGERGPVVAVSGFLDRDGRENGLVTLLNEQVTLAFAASPNLQIVERSRLARILEEQEFALSGLVDTDQAVEVGRILAADYMVTGTVVPSARSVIVFGRVVNVETGRVESVAQVIVERSEEIDSLLSL